LPAGHPVERDPGQLAARPLDVAQVLRQRAELAVRPGPLALAGHQRGQPLGVEPAGLRRRAGLARGRDPRLDQPTGPRPVGGHRPAGDEQLHDLRGTLEDPVDPHVPHHLLGGHAPLAARGQRLRGLITAAAADLHQLVHDPRAHFRAVQLGQRRLDADVVALVVGELAGQLDPPLEAVGGRAVPPAPPRKSEQLPPLPLLSPHPPLSLSDPAATSPGPPGTSPAAPPIRDPFSEQYSWAGAASMGLSLRLSWGSWLDSPPPPSRPWVVELSSQLAD